MLEFNAGIFSYMGLISFGLALLKISVGLLFARAMLYYFDKIANFNFKEWMRDAKETNPMGLSLYLATRYAVVFWFVASLLRI